MNCGLTAASFVQVRVLSSWPSHKVIHFSQFPSYTMYNKLIKKYYFYRCTVHSDIHTVHSPTNAHLLKR